MDEKMTPPPSSIKRIGGYLHRVIPIVDKSGAVASYALKPFMVEFTLRDIFQVVVGASMLAIPVAFTEEVWNLGTSLPLINVIFLAFLSIFFIAAFAYFNIYRFHMKDHFLNFFKRVILTYVLSFVVVAIVLALIQKTPWGTDNIIAIKRIVIIAFPASMSATVSDIIK